MCLLTPDSLSLIAGIQEDPSMIRPDVRDANALCDWVTAASPGATIAYHVGFLARDRYKVISDLPEDERLELDALADCVMRMREAGWVHLLQRRIKVECFAYLVVMRTRPRQRRGESVIPLPTITRRGPDQSLAVTVIREAA
jgi:hypothetical protein